MSFVEQGFAFGDPEDHFHPPGHPHNYRPEFATCPHCTPPVHGECVLLRCTDDGEWHSLFASDVIRGIRAPANHRRTSFRRLTDRLTIQNEGSRLTSDRDPLQRATSTQDGKTGSSYLSAISGRTASRLGIRKAPSSACQSSACQSSI